jgi:hypothetical protein
VGSKWRDIHIVAGAGLDAGLVVVPIDVVDKGESPRSRFGTVQRFRPEEDSRWLCYGAVDGLWQAAGGRTGARGGLDGCRGGGGSGGLASDGVQVAATPTGRGRCWLGGPIQSTASKPSPADAARGAPYRAAPPAPQTWAPSPRGSPGHSSVDLLRGALSPPGESTRLARPTDRER